MKLKADSLVAGYRPPMEELTGWKTFTPSTDGTRPPATSPKDQALPSPPNSRSKPIGKPSLNAPPSSEDALDGRPLHTDRVRTLAIPGEYSPHPNPEPRTTPVRRQNLAARRKVAGGYYDLKPQTPVSEVLKRWVGDGAKAYDDSMPQFYSAQELWPYREFTRKRETALRGFARVRGKMVELPGFVKWDVLKQDMQKRGWDLNSPLLLFVGRNGSAKIGEGNHRLAIAKELGLKRIPVRFLFDQRVVKEKHPTVSPQAVKKVVEKEVQKPLSDKDRVQIEGLMQQMEDMGILAAMKGPTFPGMNRQRKQYGDAKRYQKQYYLKNRNKIHQRMTRWYRKYKSNPLLKRDKKRRQDYPNRFKRFPGGFGSNSERGKDWREKQKKATWEVGVPIWYLPWDEEGHLMSVDTATGTVLVRTPSGSETLTLPEMFESIVFESEEDMEKVFAFLDEALGYAPGEDDPEDPNQESLIDQWYFPTEKLGWFMEKGPADSSVEYYNRGTDKKPEEHQPLEGFEPYDHPVMDNPGSAKVIPWNSDLVNNKAAARIAEIQEGCSTKLMEQAKGLIPQRVRYSPRNKMWLFDVPGSKGAYRVRVKVLPKGNTTTVSKMDVLVSCSCPYWRWQGPEHWAKVNDYLYGRSQGTAAKPSMKDPDGTHRACKHVLACFEAMKNYALIKRRNKKTAARATAIAHRYLGQANWRQC